MTHFHGNNYNNFLTKMYFKLILFVVLLIGATALAENNHEINEDELVEMAGYGEDKLSTVLITGTLLFDHSLEKTQSIPTPVPGAEVGVSCQKSKKVSKLSWVKAITDEYGDFTIDLPSELHAISNLDQKCAIKILRVPKKFYSLSSVATGVLTLSSVGNGIRTYTAHCLHLKPKNPQM